MNSIQIDDQVLAELARRVSGFHVSPNDVLRRILDLPPESPSQPGQKTPITPVPSASGSQSPLIQFIRSEKFPRHGPVVDRFIATLGWLHGANSKQFADVVENFPRSKRCYFAKSQREIENSGVMAKARQIPGSPFWALITPLDSKTKRTILVDILRALGHSPGDINLVRAELPDLGSRDRRMEAFNREFGGSS